MHVTQTYLGQTGDAGLFCYYLYEDYNDEQKQLTERVQAALDDVGADYMNEIDLYRPNPRFAGNIARELREMRPLWEHFGGKFPGFLVTYKPLAKVDPTVDTVVFLSINGRTEEEALLIVRRIRELTRENFKKARFDERQVSSKPALWEGLVNALEIKPGFYGVSLDLKKLVWPKGAANPNR